MPNPFTFPFALVCLAPVAFSQTTIDTFDLDDEVSYVSQYVESGVSEGEHFYLGTDFEPQMLEFGGRHVYVGMDEAHGTELRSVNASGGGSALFADLVPGPSGSSPKWLAEHGGAIYAWGLPPEQALILEGVRWLYVADGTSAGSGAVVDASSPGMPLGFTPEHAPRFLSTDKVVVRGKAANGDAHVYAIDLLARTVERLSTAPTSVSGVSFPREIQVEASGSFAVYFAAVGGAPTLMRTDGTAAGTTVLRTFESATGTFFPLQSWRDSRGLLEWNGHIYFPGYAAPDGLGLWRTDGTASGTSLVRAFNDYQDQAKHLDLDRGATFAGGFVLHQVSQGDFLNPDQYFHDIWRSDGTAAGTTRVTGLFTSNHWGRYVEFAGNLYFHYEGALRGLFGGGFSLPLVPDEWTDPWSAFEWDRNGYFVEGDRLWFATYNASSGPSWSSTDAVGSVQVEIPSPVGGRAGWPDTLGRDSVGNAVFFAEFGEQGPALWRQSAGQSAPTFVEWARSETTPSSNPGDFVAFGPDSELFTARDPETASFAPRTPWVHRANGTVEELAPLREPLDVEGPFQVGLVGGDFHGYFVAREPESGRELWRTDGTSVGTERVLDFTPGAEGTQFGDVIVHGGRLFFVAHRPGRDPLGESYLWVFDGGSFERLTSVPTGAELAPAGARIVFAAKAPGQGVEPWATDGTAVGTAPLVDLAPGTASSLPEKLTRVGSRVVFVADDGSTGRELFSTDGTVAGTQQVVDLTAGPGSTSFGELLDASTSTADKLIFRTGGFPAVYHVSDLALGGATPMTLPAGKVASAPEPLVHQGWLIFGSRELGTSAYDLWRSNGPTLERLTDLGIHTNKVIYKDLTASESRVHVLVDSPLFGIEPFDVLAGGQLVADTVAGGGGFNGGATPYALHANGDRLYMSQRHPLLGYELMVLQLQGASVANLGPGSVDGGDLVADSPVLGTSAQVTLSGAPVGGQGFLVMSGPVSVPTLFAGVSGSVAWLDAATAQVMATYTGSSFSLPFAVPASPGLAGQLLHLQAWNFSSPLEAPSTSNGLRLRLGS